MNRLNNWLVRSINYDLSLVMMSDSIPKWWQGMIDELEHDIESDISNVVLDVRL